MKNGRLAATGNRIINGPRLGSRIIAAIPASIIPIKNPK
jgi:hypothetical protein